MFPQNCVFLFLSSLKWDYRNQRWDRSASEKCLQLFNEESFNMRDQKVKELCDVAQQAYNLPYSSYHAIIE